MSCSFSHDRASGIKCDQRQEGQSSSPAPKAKAQIDGKIPSKGSGLRGESSSGKGGRIACRHFLRRKCTNPSCYYWHLWSVSITSLNQDANMAKRRFRHAAVDGQPSKKSKKSGRKGSVASLKESLQLGCVSQDSHPSKSIQRKGRKLVSNHTVKFSKGTWHHIQNRERKCPSLGVIQKCEPHERDPCSQILRKNTG